MHYLLDVWQVFMQDFVDERKSKYLGICLDFI